MRNIRKMMMVVALAGLTTGISQAQTTASDNQAKIKDEAAGIEKGRFTDRNKNGVCDNYESRVKTGQGRNFTDKNGDGKCDNNRGPRYGKGNQHRHGMGCRGNGPCRNSNR